MDVLIDLVPEVDIDVFTVTGQQILVKPIRVEVIKSKGGIILTGVTGPDGDGGSIDVDKVRGGLIQKGIAVTCGSGVAEIIPGMEVYYYKSASEMMVRSADELYLSIAEYNIKGYNKIVNNK